MLDEILPSLSSNIKSIIMNLPVNIKYSLEEIRLRENRPLALTINQTIYNVTERSVIKPSADYIKSSGLFYIVTHKDIENTMQLISNYSIYAFEDELKNCFITIKGGHRVGLVGRVVLENGRIKTQKNIASMNFRISKEKKGIAKYVLPYILENKTIRNALIISPPKCGKTTLLRDLARNISNMGYNTGIIDERSEIAGCFNGLPCRDVGINTDILDGCPKDIGIMLIIRSMSPQVVITDEIGRMEDLNAIQECLRTGTSLITSIHGSSLEDINERPFVKQLYLTKAFDVYITLSSKMGTGTLEKIQDKNFNVIMNGPVKME